MASDEFVRALRDCSEPGLSAERLLAALATLREEPMSVAILRATRCGKVVNGPLAVLPAAVPSSLPWQPSAGS